MLTSSAVSQYTFFRYRVQISPYFTDVSATAGGRASLTHVQSGGCYEQEAAYDIPISEQTLSFKHSSIFSPLPTAIKSGAESCDG